MIVQPETSRELFNYLKKIYNFFNKEKSNNSLIYLSKDKELCYIVGNIAGSIKITKQQTSVFEKMEIEKFYELSMLPGSRFKLKVLKENIDEELISHRNTMIRALNEGKWKCNISYKNYATISSISRYVSRYINDSYVKIISKFGECDVYENDLGIILERATVENEKLDVIETMFFYCKTYEEVDNERYDS